MLHKNCLKQSKLFHCNTSIKKKMVVVISTFPLFAYPLSHSNLFFQKCPPYPINILASFPLRAFFFPCLESNWVLETILLPKQLPFVVVLAHQLDASSAQLLAKATLFCIIKLIKITYNYFKMFVTLR